jgi:1-aminocyclopropane-1-carboxylate deaminase/D-cysteine desulfhydrase-like pyridoxal-dependent ACC family enzyme
MIQSVGGVLSSAAKIEWDLLRLDLVHPVVSGNKMFKLGPYLEQAILQHAPGLVGFGGAWSNHIHALAYAARERGLASIGIIRGEAPPGSNAMLDDCRRWGMDLRFFSRQAYRQATDVLKSRKIPIIPDDAVTNKVRDRDVLNALQDDPAFQSSKKPALPRGLADALPPDWMMVPEGGYGLLGMEGAARIWTHIPAGQYTHILCAVGTGTMVAGLALARHRREAVAHRGTDPQIPAIIGLSVLKHENQEREIDQLLDPAGVVEKPLLVHRFHGGGYARSTPALLDFMRSFYQETGIPSDLVYTSKLLWGIRQLAQEGFFPMGSRILAIHSGGLQGNRSLKKGILPY